MFRKIKSLSLIALACIITIPNVSFAENNELVKTKFDKSDFGIEKSSMEKIVTLDEMMCEYEEKLDESNSMSANNLSVNVLQNNSEGDSFEPNNTPDKASNLIYNKTINANIDTIEDIDWYKFEISQYDVENCIGELFTVILKNVPYGRDYKLNVLKKMPDGKYGIYKVNALTKSQVVFDDISAGEYLIAIAPNKNVSNNYGPENYELYIGNACIPRSTEYMDTNLVFDFGFNKYPKRFLSKAQYFDLSNDNTIPNNSLIKEVYVTSDGNGAYWIGLTKIFDGYEAAQALNYIQLPEYELPVKENHFIQAYITRSDGFIWRPRVQINYAYPLIEDNYRFYFGR